MAGMYGTYQHSLDAKGRLFIPARLREELGDEFFITISPEKCLTAYSNKSWESMLATIGARPKMDQKKIRTIFAHAANVELDGQGRILIPQTLRDYAGLGKNVAVVGMGDFAQLWDAEAWATVDAHETTPEYIAGIFEELGI